jgi:hypothetical protein
MGVEIEEEAAAKRKRTGAEPFGAAKILAQHPWTRPERVRSRRPLSFTRRARRYVRSSTKASPLFVAAYRTAAENSRGEIPARASRGDASHRRCRSSAGRIR